MATEMAVEAMFVTTTLQSWEQWIGRLSKKFASLTEEEMLAPIAPGKNRPVYLLGHLIAVNDAMIGQLRLGEPRYAHLTEPFLKEGDNPAAELPSVEELLESWTELNLRLSGLFQELTPGQWLERHALVSEEDFSREPHRNRLALLLSRVSHSSYHLGQLMMIAKTI